MRTSILLFVSLLVCGVAVASASQGSYGIYADSACSVGLYNADFTPGQCTKQESNGAYIYFIISCNAADTQFTETQYSDSACTQVSGTPGTAASGACIASGQYYGQVVCPSSRHTRKDTPFYPVSSASASVPTLLVAAMTVLLAIFA